VSNGNAGCLADIFPFLKLFVKEDNHRQNQIVSKVLPYAKRDDFLSRSEMSFYKVLQQAIDTQVIICPKVGLGDIFFVNSKDRSTFTTYNNKINRKHVDFLLCKSETLEPICGIELDDLSHEKEDRKIRDKFVDELFRVSDLPLLRFKNKASYSLIEIKEELKPVLRRCQVNISKITTETKTEETEPICPKCKIPMVKRTVNKGENKGQEFYGCSNFPKCRNIADI